MSEAQAHVYATGVKSEKVLPFADIPFSAIEALASIFGEGRAKYGKGNWRKGAGNKEYQEERLHHAMRHLGLWASGDRSENHLAKVMWFCVTQIELERVESGGRTHMEVLDDALSRLADVEAYARDLRAEMEAL